jgi:hypothetical protein
MRAPARLPRQNEMSDLLEYVAVAAGLESDWAVAGDAIGNGRPSKSLRPRQGFAHRIHCGAGWNKRRSAPVSIGVARQPADPPRTAICSSGSTGPHLRSHQLE